MVRRSEVTQFWNSSPVSGWLGLAARQERRGRPLPERLVQERVPVQLLGVWVGVISKKGLSCSHSELRAVAL